MINRLVSIMTRRVWIIFASVIALVSVSAAAFAMPSNAPVNCVLNTDPTHTVHVFYTGACPVGYWQTAGTVGPIGPQGKTGLTGPIGPQGIKGDTGPIGLQGILGIAGKDGTSVVGAQGIKGDTGPVGPIGPTGIAGPKGDTGAIGPIGPQGIKGDTGSAGATGPVGPIGPVCPVGTTLTKGFVLIAPTTNGTAVLTAVENCIVNP